MKVIKIIAGTRNSSQFEITPTSISKSGKVRSLKKDGSWIDGRYPNKDEESVLKKTLLTSKEQLEGKNTRLFSIFHIPETAEEMDETGLFKQSLYKHLLEHQNCFWYNEVVNEQGIMVKKQMNLNFNGNHLLAFELVDISEKENKEFENARLENRYRVVIDEIYDRDEAGKGEFLDLCYGFGISQCWKNAKRHNYNMMLDKLKIQPQTFKAYWDDDNRIMQNNINKAKKLISHGGDPIITSDANGMHVFNSVAMGKTDTEIKMYLDANPKEYDYLVSLVKDKPEAKKIPSVQTPAVNGAYAEIPVVTPVEKVIQKSEFLAGIQGPGKKGKYAQIHREAGLFVSRMLDAKTNNNEALQQKVRESIANARTKFESHQEYFDQYIQNKALEKGVDIS